MDAERQHVLNAIELLPTNCTSFDDALQENGINAELGLIACEDAILDTKFQKSRGRNCFWWFCCEHDWPLCTVPIQAL